MSRALEALNEAERVEAVRTLGRRALAELYERAADNAPLGLEDLVPSELPALATVIHEGKNSLPLFTRFQKRFCRPEAGAAELWGYNEQAMRAVTGPGYFVVRAQGAELFIDYTRLPSALVPGWPAMVDNSAGLSRFVYGGLSDRLRRVSRGVCVGRMFRGEKAEDTWFALVRRDPEGS